MGKWYEVTDSEVEVVGGVVPLTTYFIECKGCGSEFETPSLYEASKNNPACPACGYAGEED